MDVQNSLIKTGTAFAAPVKLLDGAFYGEAGTTAGDIDGDGKDDLIGFNRTFESYVTRSFGTSLGNPVRVAAKAFFGANVSLAADADGDGKVDLIAIDADKVRVALSTGAFVDNAVVAAPGVWFNGIAFGTQATLAAKVR